MELGGGGRSVVSDARLYTKVFMPTQFGAHLFYTQEKHVHDKKYCGINNKIKALAEILADSIDA